MDEVERKEEPSLPPDYVSLAQLREQWLQKQEEKKLKQKQEEEQKRERDERAQKEKMLKQRQEEEQKREREDWAQKEKNQNQRGNARIAGGFVRGTSMILDQGKGKEIINGGTVNGGEIDKRSEVIRGGRTRNFRRAAAVEDRANQLGGGDRCEGAGIVVGGDGVEQIYSVSVVDVLPSNGVVDEIANVKRADLRGGLRVSGRNWDSHRANELEHGETGLDSEKEVENERGHAQNRRGRSRKGGNKGRLKGKRVDSEPEKNAEEFSEVCREIGSLCVADGNGFGVLKSKCSDKAEEEIHKGEGSNGDEVELKIERVDHDGLAGESAKIGKNRKGYQINENRRSNFGQERSHKIPEIVAEKDIIEGEGSIGNKVALEIEKKVDHEILAGESEKVGENKGAVKGNRKKKDKKKDFGKGSRNARPELSVEEDRVEGDGSNVNKVAPEIEKVDHDVQTGGSAKTGENRWMVKGYQKNEDQRRDFGPERRSTRPEISAEVDKIVGEGSNGKEVRRNIKKEVGHVVLSGDSGKIGDNRGVIKDYQTNRTGRSGFGRGRGWKHTRFEISDSRMKTNSRENGMVWVKKEEKLEA